LYAFCRRADDAVDEQADGGLARVDGLRRRLDAVYAGSAGDNPIDRAFAALVEEVRLPRALPEALLAGMEMDARPAEYREEGDLLVYCFRVASSVGLMMTKVMGTSSDAAWLRAADLGVAMQLTNIARDVGEDARRGRVYLPSSLLDSVGVSRADVLSASTASPSLREAVKQLLARAEAHYRSADLGIPMLPRGCRLAIRASRLIYADIGRVLAASGYDSITRRAHTSLPRKLALVAAAVPALFSSSAAQLAPGPADNVLAPLVTAAVNA
jgi:phytoene synthase